MTTDSDSWRDFVQNRFHETGIGWVNVGFTTPTPGAAAPALMGPRHLPHGEGSYGVDGDDGDDGDDRDDGGDGDDGDDWGRRGRWGR